MAAGLPRASYVPVGRVFHSDVVVGEKLFSWGGRRKGAPDVKDCRSAEKMRMTSVIDVFHCKNGNWENDRTNASSDNDRPLGVQGHSAAAIGRHIYYVGGYCGHGTCYHNSIHSLGVDTMEWKCLSPSSDQVPMLKKAYFRLIPFDGEILLAVGGFGRYRHPYLPEEKYSYEEDSSHYVFTNEHTMFNVNSGDWTSPAITGDVPPPIANFSLDMISLTKAVMFGGMTKDNNNCSDLRLATIKRDSVHWELVRTTGIEKPRSGLGGAVAGLLSGPPKEEKPRARRRHATASLFPSVDRQHVTFLVMGGDETGTIGDCWVLDVTGRKAWKSMSLPDSIMKRRDHSISVIASTGGCIWIMVVGGDTNSTFSTPTTAILELSTGHWESLLVMKDSEIYAGYQKKYLEKFSAASELWLMDTEMKVAALRLEVTGLQDGKSQLEKELTTTTDKLREVSKEKDSQFSELQLIKKMSQMKDAELDSLQPKLGRLQLQLKASEDKVQTVKEELQAKHSEIDELQGELKASKDKVQKIKKESQAEIDELCLQLKASEGKIQVVEENSQAKDYQIDKQKLQLDEKEEILQDSHSQRDLLQLRVKAIEEDKCELEQEIKSAKIKISNLESDIRLMTSTSLEKDALVSEYEMRIKKSEVSLSELSDLKTKNQEEISQLKQQLEELKEGPHVKKRTGKLDTATQANYLSVVGDSVRGIEECGEIVLEITGSRQQKVSWDDYGFHVTVPDGAVPDGVTISLAVKATLSGHFKLPDDSHLVSAIYWVSASEMFLKEVSVHIQHCAVIKSEVDAAKYKFIVAKCSQEDLPYTFKILDGVFSPWSSLATVSVKQFSFFAVIFQGWWRDLKRRYLFHRCCKQISETNWEYSLLVTVDTDIMIKLVREEYPEPWTVGNRKVIEFEEQYRQPVAAEMERAVADTCDDDSSITIEITDAEQGESQDWDITLTSSPHIKKKDVDECMKRNRAPLPSCELAMDWKGLPRTDLIPVCKRRVNLRGAKDPCNYFVLHICPKARFHRSIEPNICNGASLEALPDGILESCHLDDVLTCVESFGLVTRWDRIGTRLRVSYADLQIIKKEETRENDRLAAMLDKWLRSGKATKGALAAALRAFR